jgi:hypothetical protein
MFTVRTMRNTQMHSVNGIRSFGLLKQVGHTGPLDFEGLNTVRLHFLQFTRLSMY